jgi:hypothetical protein
MAARFRWLIWAPAAWFVVGGLALYALFGESVAVPIALFSGILLILVICRRHDSKFLCPFCGARLSRVLPASCYWRFPTEIAYLPCCGHSMAETVDQEEKSA